MLLCRRLLNDTFVTPEEVAGSLGLQPLATIPEAQPEGGAGQARPHPAQMEERPVMKTLVIDQMPQLPFQVSEAINQLRINLGFCGSQIKTIMITSSSAQRGQELPDHPAVEADGRGGHPGDCSWTATSATPRCAANTASAARTAASCWVRPHCLAGQAQLEDVIYSTNIPQGYMIPVASTIANPTILLESPRFARMLEDCAGRFGCVLVDTPPSGQPWPTG